MFSVNSFGFSMDISITSKLKERNSGIQKEKKKKNNSKNQKYLITKKERKEIKEMWKHKK